MPTWPITLPQKFEQEGYSEKEPNLFVMTEMDAGPPKRRRRFYATHRPISGTMIMTTAQKAIFKTFFQTYGGLSFTFPDPDSSGTVSVIFMAAPEYMSYASEDWQVSIQIAVMP
jgi:hypothetical protein